MQPAGSEPEPVTERLSKLAEGGRVCAGHRKLAEGGLSAVEAFARRGQLDEASIAALAAPRGCGLAVYRNASPGAHCRAVLQPAAAAAGERGAH